MKIAEYNGEPHMTFYAGNDEAAGDRGHGIIMNSNYATVKTVTSGLGRAPADIHEFTVLDGKTAITTIYQPIQFDLSNNGLQQPWGWVVEGIFQEIDIATGEVLFEWRSLDHEETLPSHTYNTYGGIGANNGSFAALAWDYL
jgi:Arylsulfotransferase (ASST)